MNKFFYKAATGLATASLLASAFTPLAFADTTVEISGNGTDSTNTANVNIENLTVVEQSNDANIQNNVTVIANSGNNEANDNTGGDVSIDTGNAQATVSVSNTANSNQAEVNSCCPGDTTVKIKDNGSNTDNTVNLGVCNSHQEDCGTFVTQKNKANILNTVKVNLDTGNNEANDNTGGNVKIKTGNAKANDGISISNNANENLAVVGGGTGGSLDIEISGNGTDSTNTANVDIESLTVVDQSNVANIWNDVVITANSGNNEANDNTGGNVEIDTGNAEATAKLKNAANFNAADVDGCGCFFDVFVKIKDNGSNSDNTVNLDLQSSLFVEQLNDFDCKGEVDPCADVKVNSDTGNNEANDNTQGGEPEIDTGTAGADISVENEANSNIVGDVDLSDFDFPDLDLDDLPGDLSSLILLLIGLFS